MKSEEFSTIFLHAPTMAKELFGYYCSPSLEELRDYIVAHIDEDITPESVIEQFGLPYQLTLSSFQCRMGETMPEMIHRMKTERSKETP